MSELRLSIVDDNCVPSITCGVDSIDCMIKEAYYKTLFKQAFAYNILLDNTIVGSCMIKFSVICDEEYCIRDPEYTAFEISYLAIDKRFQHRNIGTYVLKVLILKAHDLSKKWPIRFLIIEALPGKEEWYVKAGFSEYPRRKEPQYLDTISMRMDFLDKEKVDKYTEQL